MESQDLLKFSVFRELKPLCTTLFFLLGKEGCKDPEPLIALTSYIQRAPLPGLQPCLDYILVPLLLLLDASIACRNVRTEEQLATSLEHFETVRIPDSVAEAVLSCLEQLLHKCTIATVEQMSMLLRKIASGALLSPSQASEEFRHGIVRCLRALLDGLKPCSNGSCCCKLILSPSLSLLSLKSITKATNSSIKQSHSTTARKGCLMAFLLSEDASVAVGHWLSLLLQMAEAEVDRGHRGCGKLRIDALETLRLFISKVGTPHALAFFLPGVLSRLAKALHLPRSRTGNSVQVTSGAAGRKEAIEHAIRGMGEILILTLRDEWNPTEINNDECLWASGSSEPNLEALRLLLESSHSENSLQASEKSDNCFLNDKAVKPFIGQNGSSGSQFRVKRDKKWLEETADRVDCIIANTFPSLCTHPAGSVRLSLAEASGALLLKCNSTLRKSKLVLWECLLALFCDECSDVSSVAHDFLFIGFSFEQKKAQNKLNELLSRLIENLPKPILKGDQQLALLYAKRLLAAIYFTGPEGMSNHLFLSHIQISKFLDVMKQCLSLTTVLSGSIEEAASRQLQQSAGYIPAILEINTNISPRKNENFHPQPPQLLALDAIDNLINGNAKDYLPSIPPWFIQTGSQKLYECLAGILRFSGRCAVDVLQVGLPLQILIDMNLEHLRHLISDLRHKENGQEEWYAWYVRSGSGKILRDAAVYVCIINEIIYGASNKFSYKNLQLFKGGFASSAQKWEKVEESEQSEHVTECVSNVLHEYISSEIWALPVDVQSTSLRQDPSCYNLPWHFFQDVSVFLQVILEGIGVFGVSLGKEFENNGFLYSTLYLLLENLTSTSYNISSTADRALRMISTAAGYQTVKDMVISNIDYLIDSLCRQLRHVVLYPHAPGVLATMLSSVGAVRDIVPLLEEPMRSISMSLELLPRQQHPYLTLSSLKALNGIVKALTQEAQLIAQSSSENKIHIVSKAQHLKSKRGGPGVEPSDSLANVILGSQNSNAENVSEVNKISENWEKIFLSMDDRIRYGVSIAKILESSLAVSTPLLGSKEKETCIVSLEIVENGVSLLAMVEEALKHEQESRETIEWVLEKFSIATLLDSLKSIDITIDTNKVLPMMNQIWPYLIACLKQAIPQVVSRCMAVIGKVVIVCGGDFFVRRFKTDAVHFIRFFSLDKCVQAKKPLVLPYRNSMALTTRKDIAEGSILKVQESFFKMIVTIAGNKKSASALDGVLQQFAALSVGFACGSPKLHRTATDALLALRNIDANLIGKLLSDIAYSKRDECPNPLDRQLRSIKKDSSPPQSLWVQYAGNDYGLKSDVLIAKKLLAMLDSTSP